MGGRVNKQPETHALQQKYQYHVITGKPRREALGSDASRILGIFIWCCCLIVEMYNFYYRFRLNHTYTRGKNKTVWVKIWHRALKAFSRFRNDSCVCWKILFTQTAGVCAEYCLHLNPTSWAVIPLISPRRSPSYQDHRVPDLQRPEDLHGDEQQVVWWPHCLLQSRETEVSMTHSMCACACVSVSMSHKLLEEKTEDPKTVF